MVLPLLSASDTASAAPTAAGTSAAFFFASTGASARLAPSRIAAMSRSNTAAARSPTLVSTEKRPPTPV
jgi:hypothetical protein